MSKKFKFSSVEEGRFIITRFDDYLERISPMERSMKMNTNRFVFEDEFISFLEDSVLSWNFKDISFIGSVILKLNELLAAFNLGFDEDIELVKTTGKEEWNCAYTRANAIFLPVSKIETYNSEKMLKLLAHEFCHVLLRRKKELKSKLYHIIGFKFVNEIALDSTTAALKLTNPDAPCINCFIEVNYKGKLIKVTPVCVLKENKTFVNTAEDIVESISMKLAVVEEVNNKWTIKTVNEKALMLGVNDITGFYEQIGRNTDYIIHPEEILAENFVLLLEGEKEVPSPEVLSKIKTVLGYN